MSRIALIVLAALVLVQAGVEAGVPGARTSRAAVQADVTGEWEAQYQTPLGPQELKMYLSQEGPRITGHTTSEFGEFPIRGSINGADVKLSWTEVDAGKELPISVTGKVEGDK